MADQQAKDKKTRLVLIILLVVAIVSLVGYLVIGSGDSEPEQPVTQTAPAEDGAPAGEETSNPETGQPVTPTEQTETDPTLIEGQAIIDELKAIDQRFKAAAATCDQTAIDNTKLTGDGVLARLGALSAAVTDPTPAHDDLINQINAQLEANAVTELELLTQCSGSSQS